MLAAGWRPESEAARAAGFGLSSTISRDSSTRRGGGGGGGGEEAGGVTPHVGNERLVIRPRPFVIELCIADHNSL